MLWAGGQPVVLLELTVWCADVPDKDARLFGPRLPGDGRLQSTVPTVVCVGALLKERNDGEGLVVL